MATAAELESLEAQLGEERQKVDVASHDFSVREIARMLGEGELNIAPEYQRKYRWKADTASTFIESLFLGLPVPPIFVATNDDFQLEVVDGLQRISTMLNYMSDLPEDLLKIGRTKVLRLEGLQKLSQLNDTIYGDLPKSLQRYFGRQPVQVISLTDKSSKDVRFDLFERLNAGAIALSSQEVRACIFRGKFNDFVEELAGSADFRSLLKLQTAKQVDGTSAEEVLKFFAYKNFRDKFDGRVKIFLNSYAKSALEQFEYAEERRVFEAAMRFLAEINDGQPFLRASTNVTPLVQFEACAVAAGELLQAGLRPIRPATASWREDEELVAASTGATNSRSLLGKRIDRAKALFRANA
jgi:hypothetical protein